MTWDFYNTGEECILKDKKREVPRKLLDSLDPKQRKALKKTIQAAEPSQFFGEDFKKLDDLLEMLQDLPLTKSDKKLNKKMKTMKERNLDMVASLAKVRKEYELLYKQLYDIVYSTGKKEEKK